MTKRLIRAFRKGVVPFLTSRILNRNRDSVQDCVLKGGGNGGINTRKAA